MNEPKWYYGTNEDSEQWFGPHDTREECISKGTSSSFVIVQAVKSQLIYRFDADAVTALLENMAYHSVNDEAISEHGELPSATDEQITELMNLLNKAIDEWTAMHPELTQGTMLEFVSEFEKITPPIESTP